MKYVTFDPESFKINHNIDGFFPIHATVKDNKK